ncbi:hypothetical protein CC86DRAFT_250664, partial [Ophiobolus disseminans]
FLDLPKAVRVKVYESLPHRTVRNEFVKTKKGKTVSSFAFVVSSVPIAILATCRTIHGESKPIAQNKIDHLLNRDASDVLYPRIKVDFESLAALCSGFGPFKAIRTYFHHLRENLTQRNDLEGTRSLFEA